MSAPKKYPDELRERAVRLVFEIRRERGSSHGVIPEVAARLGIGDQSLRAWVKQAEIDVQIAVRSSVGYPDGIAIRLQGVHDA